LSNKTNGDTLARPNWHVTDANLNNQALLSV